MRRPVKKSVVSSQWSVVKILLFFLLFTIHCSLFISFADTPVYLSITKESGTKIIIAIPDFSIQEGISDRENLSRKSSEILMEDLKTSGLFKTVDDRAILNKINEKDKKSGKVDFKEWLSSGAETLVKGHINIENSKLNIECRLYDLKRGEQITGYKYIGDKTAFRQIIHRFSDEITYRFTGEKGIAMTMLAFVSKVEGNKEIFISDYDGHNIRKITNDKSISLFPKWSPDGKNISYTTFRYRNPDLYLINISEGRRKAVANFPGTNTSASWSPDGKKLVVSLSKDGNPEIYTIDPDGNNLQRLTNSRSIDTSPAWSPNGMEIAYTSDKSGTPQIYIIGSDGTNIRRLTYEGNYNDHASWSPDGSNIAYSSLNDRHFDIFVLNLTSGNVQQLTSGNGDNQNPSWSPDGRHIAFSSNREGKYQIFMMKADGTEQRRIIYIEGGGYSPSWSPRIEHLEN